MAYYVKKPVVIQAFDFLKETKDNQGQCLIDEYIKGKPYINTLEGQFYVREDDFIIIGIKGEKYPIRRDIFFACYSPVEELH
jgi:hypothetical protein